MPPRPAKPTLAPLRNTPPRDPQHLSSARTDHPATRHGPAPPQPHDGQKQPGNAAEPTPPHPHQTPAHQTHEPADGPPDQTPPPHSAPTTPTAAPQTPA